MTTKTTPLDPLASQTYEVRSFWPGGSLNSDRWRNPVKLSQLGASLAGSYVSGRNENPFFIHPRFNEVCRIATQNYSDISERSLAMDLLTKKVFRSKMNNMTTDETTPAATTPFSSAVPVPDPTPAVAAPTTSSVDPKPTVAPASSVVPKSTAKPSKALTRATTSVSPTIMRPRPLSKSTIVTQVPLTELGSALAPTGYDDAQVDLYHARFREVDYLGTGAGEAVEAGQIWIHFNKSKKRELVIVNEVHVDGNVELTVIFLDRQFSGKRVGQVMQASIADFYVADSAYSRYGSVVGV